MSRIPYEALSAGKDGEYLIDQYEISYLSTSRDILRFEKIISGIPNDPLVIVDPDFDLESIDKYVNSKSPKDFELAGASRAYDLNYNTFHFPRLPGTRREGEIISGLLHVRMWSGGEALEHRLKSYRSPRILHVATHGFFLPNESGLKDDGDTIIDPDISSTLRNLTPIDFGVQNSGNRMLRSGLALAGANTWLRHRPLPPEAEDGILTAEDVTSMDLLNTELVVLSSCDTALGDILNGEGVFGLRRAFVLAGAHTLIMSMWKIADNETTELMIEFYKNILSGESRSQSLRQAQLSIKRKRPNPYYWGAFICQGNYGPLTTKII